MTTTPSAARSFPAQAPVDERGRLLHEGDAAAQLALCLANLESLLAVAGQTPADLVEVEVRTTDARLLAEVCDVLTERLDATGGHPRITVTEVEDLGDPGLFVVLGGTTSSIHPVPEGSSMSLETTLDSATGSPAESLRGLCGGRVHLPGDPAYDVARVPWNVAVDQRPAAVAVPHTPAEVAEVVRAAAAAGLRVAPQSSGHNAAPLAEHGLDDVVLVRLHEMTGVSIDPEARTARVVGGTLWRDVVAAAAPYGLAAMHGSSPDVAVAGYVLGGGLSWYARRHGLAADSLTAVEVVTADGTLVRADAEHHVDLFWALRGGGGNLGVVTAIELRLLPVPDVYAGMLLWDRERAPEVVRTWAAWTRDLPESVTTSLRVMSFPPLPDLPPFLSGRQLVVVDGAVLEGDERAVELLAPLRALAPEMDTFGRMPAAGLPEIHMDPPGPTPAVSDHAMLGRFGEEAVAALLAEVGPGTTTPLLFAEVRHLGGALGRPAPGGGVLDHLPAAYALFCVAVAPVPEAAAAGLAAAARVVAALAPWSVASRVLNFTERAVDASSGYDGEAWARLCRVRDAYDPTGVLLANHPLN
ncbi:FAD-binding oxidoreductase [Nocardioides sp. MAHUQ-72]|uniref:FAD-binding oxidoreductase n=1 Tax=unclassified Nocardioides TaxID=2615069 RepID=UPI00362280E2